MKILNKLETILLNEDKFKDEQGNLLKSAVQTAALNLDPVLVKILLNDDDTKKAFFTDVAGVMVFDKVKFSWVINNSEFLPDSFTSFSNKIGLVDETGKFINSNKDVTLAFPYKDCVLEFDSTSEVEDRDEVFLNETLASSSIDTLFDAKAFDNPTLHSKNSEESVSSFDDGNLLIKGNNLIALYSLLPRYEGRIKLMYWDILYNTNSDNVPYNDKFKHSSWLTMMKNRLEVAQRLLDSNNGVIVLQCDDNEQAYLKVLCDEVFGRDNFVNCICVKMSDASGPKMAHVSKKFPKLKEYLLIYKKDILTINKVTEPKKEWDSEYKNFLDLTKEEIDSYLKEQDPAKLEKLNNVLPSRLISLEQAFSKYNVKQKERFSFCVENAFRIARTSNAATIKRAVEASGLVKNIQIMPFNGTNIFVKADFDRNSGDPRVQYVFAEETINVPLCDLWLNVNTSFNAEGGVTLKNGQKPEYLIKLIITALSNKNDIVLDAYFGSGTTGAVAMKMGRKFIGIEQLDSHYKMSIERLNNVIKGEQSGISKEVKWGGGGSFTTVELMKRNEILINEAIHSTSEKIDELFDKLMDSPFVLNYKVNTDVLASVSKDEEFKALTLDDKKKVLVSLLDKNMIYVNKSEINDSELNVNTNVKEFNKSFYGE